MSVRGKRGASRKVVSNDKRTKASLKSQSNDVDKGDFEFKSLDIWMLGDSYSSLAGVYDTERGAPT